MENPNRRGFNDYRIPRAWGITHLRSSEGNGDENMEAVRGMVWIFSIIAHFEQANHSGLMGLLELLELTTDALILTIQVTATTLWI